MNSSNICMHKLSSSFTIIQSRRRVVYIVFALLLTCFTSSNLMSQLKFAIAGLSHDHVSGILQKYANGQVIITGIAESDKNLVARYKQRYRIPDALFFDNLAALLKKEKPDAVMAFNAISEHIDVVRACAPYGIHVMVEKPLAATMKDATEMATLARKHNIHLLTNYETTWYASNQHLFRKIKDSASIGDIRKMVVHDGHQGPKEIGVSSEFLKWLTDPEKNGGGAIIDFGCYGANLMTWLMQGKQPVAVTAITKTIKPAIYPKVDDDATILLEYENATGIIEASWNWPFNIKDMEVFGSTGYLQAVNSNTIRVKEKPNQPYTISQLPAPVAPYHDYVPFFTAVINGQVQDKHDLSSLENNLIVVKILDAARRSAKEGKRIVLK
jgi:predicted dehydrogenase